MKTQTRAGWGIHPVPTFRDGCRDRLWADNENDAYLFITMGALHGNAANGALASCNAGALQDEFLRWSVGTRWDYFYQLPKRQSPWKK